MADMAEEVFIERMRLNFSLPPSRPQDTEIQDLEGI